MIRFYLPEMAEGPFGDDSPNPNHDFSEVTVWHLNRETDDKPLDGLGL